MTKKQKTATICDFPLYQMIDHDKVLKRLAELSRVQLIANGAPKKKVDKLSDQEATFWAGEQMRQFCGMGPSMQYLDLFGWPKKRTKKRKA